MCYSVSLLKFINFQSVTKILNDIKRNKKKDILGI